MTSFQYICSECNRKYHPATFVWRCECGGLLDLDKFEARLNLDKIKDRPASLWRYFEALPFLDNQVWSAITMGEGVTPLIKSLESPNVWFKLDYVMPTLSFKDRGAAVLVAKAKELGATKVLVDSSGNAGTSISAYAGRLGMECHVYVPESTSSKKVKQMAKHGANVHLIPGNREDTAAAAKDAVESGEFFYASHVYNPFFYQGIKTMAYEIWQDMGGECPEQLILPVGNGSLLLGAYYGFRDLLNMGYTDRMPRFIAVQAENCSPLAQAYQAGSPFAEPTANTGTLAEGIAVAAPPRSRQILAAVQDTGGTFISVDENSIQNARNELALKGFYVEPTTAATYAGYSQYMENKGVSLSPDERLVIILCGAGLKAD